MTIFSNDATLGGGRMWDDSTWLGRMQHFLDARQVPYVFIGSFLEEIARNGDTYQANDIDVVVDLNAWNEGLSRAERNQFEIAMNHQRFIGRLTAAGTLHRMDRLVYRLRAGASLQDTLHENPERPFEVSALVNFTSAKEIAENHSLGVHQLSFDAEGFWSTPAHREDMANNTLTVMCCADIWEAKRTILRLDRLLSTRFKGWEPRWGSAFEPLIGEAFEMLCAEEQALNHFGKTR